jgi:hypothetical protein
MSDDRKKPGAVYWASVALITVLLAYPLSFGPACWWFASAEPDLFVRLASPTPAHEYAPYAYWPIGWLAENGPGPVGDGIFWYATRRYDRITLPTDRSGVSFYSSDFHALERAFDRRD